MFFKDPLIIFKPNQWPMIWNYRKTIAKLRDIGQKETMKRIEALKNGVSLPEDILTLALSNDGTKICFFMCY